MNCMKKFKITNGTIQSDESSQSVTKNVPVKIRTCWKKTMMNATELYNATEINLRSKPGHYPMNQTPRHYQFIYKKKWRRNWKTKKR